MKYIIAETDFSVIYLDDETQSCIINFTENEDYPHFKNLFESEYKEMNLCAFFKAFYRYFLEKVKVLE